jgi:NAD-dependent SIR2 family protein deacetylase
VINQSLGAVDGKRDHGFGYYRPRIVLYDELCPDGEEIEKVEFDLRLRLDVVLVVGATFTIPGVQDIVQSMVSAVHEQPNGVIA